MIRNKNSKYEYFSLILLINLLACFTLCLTNQTVLTKKTGAASFKLVRRYLVDDQLADNTVFEMRRLFIYKMPEQLRDLEMQQDFLV